MSASVLFPTRRCRHLLFCRFRTQLDLASAKAERINCLERLWPKSEQAPAKLDIKQLSRSTRGEINQLPRSTCGEKRGSVDLGICLFPLPPLRDTIPFWPRRASLLRRPASQTARHTGRERGRQTNRPTGSYFVISVLWKEVRWLPEESVSYTHLTLPTKA